MTLGLPRAAIEPRTVQGQMALPAPYYQDSAVTIYHGDCREILPQIGRGVIITDPPYNVGYHYEGYWDRLEKSEYLKLLRDAMPLPAVVLHYPEDMFDVSLALGQPPSECAAWVYNAHTPRKWRMVAWFACKPDFSLVTQPYKNSGDKRIAAKLERGSDGCSLYDWWNDEQVKNVSEEKTEHPCQIPIDVMAKIIGVTLAPRIIDPFCGSGTTLRAAKNAHRPAVGIELNERYCEIAAKRMEQEVMDFGEITPTTTITSEEFLSLP